MTEEEKHKKNKQYQKAYRERKKRGLVNDIRKYEKIGNWKIENNKEKNVSILSCYLKFRFYIDVGGGVIYDEKRYIPIQTQIKKALDEYSTIIVIEKGQLQVYVKGIGNRHKVIEILDKLIQQFENQYGRDYENVRSRKYGKKKCAENLE